MRGLQPTLAIDNSAYILGQAQHSARESWIYIDGENFEAARVDIGGGGGGG